MNEPYEDGEAYGVLHIIDATFLLAVHVAMHYLHEFSIRNDLQRFRVTMFLIGAGVTLPLPKHKFKVHAPFFGASHNVNRFDIYPEYTANEYYNKKDKSQRLR